ncbi:hypothetical protein SK128_026848, partial [Halocaridina rubra]
MSKSETCILTQNESFSVGHFVNGVGVFVDSWGGSCFGYDDDGKEAPRILTTLHDAVKARFGEQKMMSGDD